MQNKLAQLGVPYTPLLFANPGGQLVVGKVSWRQPPRSLGGGVFFVLLIDKGSHLKPPRMTAGGSPPTQVGVGDDGVLSDVEARYPWLRGAGLLGPDGKTYMSGGASITVPEPKASPVGFVALFPAVREATTEFPYYYYYATAPVSPSNLMMALVFIVRIGRSTGRSGYLADGQPRRSGRAAVGGGCRAWLGWRGFRLLAGPVANRRT